jgi:hypothetical protein
MLEEIIGREREIERVKEEEGKESNEGGRKREVDTPVINY